jgi:hypothetical protein
MVCLTAAIVWLAWVQYTVSQGQLAVMQRQLNDAEIKDSASVVIRNMALSGFPDNTVVSFDVSNIGATRADMVSVVDFHRELTRDFHRELSRLDDGFGVRRSSSFEISPSRVWRLSPSCS